MGLSVAIAVVVVAAHVGLLSSQVNVPVDSTRWPRTVLYAGRPVLLTEGDTLHLRWQSRLGPLDRCAVALPGGAETTLSPKIDGGTDPTYAGDGYASGQCGLRADNVAPGVGNWTLKARAADGRHEWHTSRVTCIAKQWPRSSTIRVPVGTAVNITCGPLTALYCRMSGPSGQTSRHEGQCRVHIKSVGSHHLNAWTCWSVMAESVAEDQYTVNLQIYREGATVQVGSSETPSEVRVYCNVRDGGVPTTTANRTAGDGWLRSTHCKLSLPRDAQTLSLAYGRGTARYAYYGTDDGDCGASFPKPVTPAEVGRWRCANTMSDGRVYGGFIVVNGTKGNIDPLVVTTGRPTIVPKGQTFHVECNVPSEIDYCWLRHPNGTAIPVTVPDLHDSTTFDRTGSRYRYTGEGLSFGQCRVAVDQASAADTGAWLCALGLRGDRHEIYGSMVVTVSESVIAARQDELYVTEGSTVTLGCYTVENQPVAYCRFFTPRLFGFAVDEQSRSASSLRFTYSGQGLTAGHCGLSVDRVDDADYGNWTCAVKILDSSGSEEVSITIVLRKPEGFTMVQIIGIVFCGTLISILSLFFANHLITNPSTKTRKKIEKLELLEVAIDKENSRNRNSYKHPQNSIRIVRTQPTKSKPRPIPRRI